MVHAIPVDPKQKQASPKATGIRLKDFRLPYNIVGTNSSGFAVGGYLEGGAIQGQVLDIEVREFGVVVVTVENGETLQRVCITPSGYGELDE